MRTKIQIRQVIGVPVCGEGCCHDDGVMIEKIVDGEFVDDEFYPTMNAEETSKIIDILKWVYGNENVTFKSLK